MSVRNHVFLSFFIQKWENDPFICVCVMLMFLCVCICMSNRSTPTYTWTYLWNNFAVVCFEAKFKYLFSSSINIPLEETGFQMKIKTKNEIKKSGISSLEFFLKQE